VASAIDGAAPNNPAKLFGLKTSPRTAKRLTTKPPTINLTTISLIPFTLQQTTLGERHAGDQVHLEADMLGKYVAALLESRIAAPGAEVSA